MTTAYRRRYLHYLTGHIVTEARDRGWDTLSNGDLLSEAERAGFDILLTADKNIRYQQNLAGRKIAVVVLSTPQCPMVRLHTARVAGVVNAATPGSYAEVEIPHKAGPQSPQGASKTQVQQVALLPNLAIIAQSFGGTRRPCPHRCDRNGENL